MKDTIVLRSSTLLSEVSPHFNYPDQVSQYFSDTYGENHIVFKTTETLGNYEKHVVVLKFDQCGVANRVKQRYNGRVLFNSRITTTFLDARQVDELGLDKDKVATSLSTSKKKKKLQPVQKEQEEWMYRHGLLEEEEEEEEKVKRNYELLFFSEGNDESAHFDQSYESYDTVLPPAMLPGDSTYTRDHYSRNTADLDNDDQDSWTYYRTKKERDRRRKDRSYEKERDRSYERHRRHRSSSSTSSSHTTKKDTSSRSSRKRYREDRTESYNSSRSQSQSLSDDMTQDSMLQRDTSYPNYTYDYNEQYYYSESQDYVETDSTGILSQDNTEWVEYYGSNPIVKEEPTNDDSENEEDDSDNNGQIKQVSFVLGDCLAMLRQDTNAPTDTDKASKESVDKKDKTRHSNDSKKHKKSRESRRTSSERDHHKRKRSHSEQDLESDEGSKELQPPKKLPKSRKDDSQHSKDHHQKSNESSTPEKEESVKSKHESSPLKNDDSTRSSQSKETISKIDSSGQEKSTQKKEEHVKRHSTSKASREDSSRSSKEYGTQSGKTEETKKEHTSKSTSNQPVKHSSTQSQTKEPKKDSASGKSKKTEKSLPTRDDSTQETNISSKENSKQELSFTQKKNESKEGTDNSKNDAMSQASTVTTPTNTTATTTQPILAGPPSNIGPALTSTPLVIPGSITTPSVMPGPLATMVPTLASTPLVTSTSVATPSSAPTPTVPIMVPIYLPCTPEYQQMLLTHYQQLALTNPSASLWPYPVEDSQQFTRSRSGTPVMDETEEVHPATTTTPIVENKVPSNTSDLPIATTCTDELQQTQSTTCTSTNFNNKLQSAPISQIPVTQSIDTAHFTLTNSTITSSVVTTPPIALIPMPVAQSNNKVGSVEPSNKPFCSEPNHTTLETQFDSVDSYTIPVTNIPSVSYEPAISDSFIADVSPHTQLLDPNVIPQPLDPNVIQIPNVMQKDEEETMIENPPSPLSLKRIDPDVNFKKYKSETMKEYWEQAKIMLASTKVLASVSDPNQLIDITASLEKSLQLVARNLLTNFRKRTGIIEDRII